MKRHKILATAIILTTFLSGCASWSYSNVQRYDETEVVGKEKTELASIEVTEKDISDRPYAVLADITAMVNKTTAFHPTPTKEMVNRKLQQKAAELGADAVILVRYGDAGVSFWSWGSLEGKGRAISFK